MQWLAQYAECLEFNFFYSYLATLGAEHSADLSTLFDFGGIVGAILAGILSDWSGMSATTCSGMLILAVPMLLVYQIYGSLSIALNIVLLFILGILVNGPYALITTSVSAELGKISFLFEWMDFHKRNRFEQNICFVWRASIVVFVLLYSRMVSSLNRLYLCLYAGQHSTLEGNSKALATVTAIIDGTGSLGAAVGPFLAGFFSSSGWQNVFYMLMIADVLALLLLIKLVAKEIDRFKRNTRIDWSSQIIIFWLLFQKLM